MIQIKMNAQYEHLVKEHEHIAKSLIQAAEKLLNAKDEARLIVDDLRVERLASVGGCLITCPGLSPRPVIGRIIY
jgi:hypothetical protein